MLGSLRFRLPALFLLGVVLSGLVASVIAVRFFQSYERTRAIAELRSETVGVVQSVLSGRSDTRLEDALALVPEANDAESAHLPGAVQLWPHRHGTDAMFMALLRRVP
ncbi:MAG: hypothetical protein ACXWYO_08535 [Gaiellaceae bacterium]